MKKKIFAFAAAFVLAMFSFAQSSVQIKDIYVQPVTGIESTSTNNQLEVMFKMNSQEEASVLHLQFGTAQDLGDVLTIDAEITEQGEQYYVSYDGEDQLIIGYDTSLTVELTANQASSYNYITLLVEDSNGEMSNKLYFVK